MFFKLYLTSRRVVAGIALLFSAGPLFAATITVTSSEDVAGGSCPGASCTLRQAIATAAPGDTIFFNIPTFAGGYNATTQVFSLFLGSELVISKNLTIDGGANKIVLIRPSALPQFRILNVTSGTVTIARLTITGGSLNSGAASDVGAGVQNAGNLTLSACTITSNNAGNGGGGVFNSGTIVLRNCTVANNTTGTSGGGSGVKNVGNATLTSCAIVGNNQVGGASVGAGVFTSGTTHVGNTVIAKNATGAGGADDVAGNFLSDGYNFIGTADASSGFGTGSHDQTGTKAALLDPRLSALRDNGGPTKTMEPFSNSLLVNQGNSGGLTTDQRGDPRPIGQAGVAGGDGSDIGAVERGPQQFPNSGTNLTVTNTDEHNDHECRVDDCTLAAAIEAGNFIAANAAMGAVTIKFAPGLSGVILNTTAPTGLGIVAALNIVGPGARVITISGNNVARVFNVTSGTANIVNISGLTIANGHINDSGGGIFNSANLTLRDCAVLNNSGGSGGGAVNGATMHVTNCTFAGNQSTGNGGALRNVGDLVVTNSTFNNNTAVSSGAIASFVSNGQPALTLNVINCSISGNTASDPTNGTGGGILNGNLSTATVSNTIVAKNTATTGTDVSGPFTSGGHNLIRIATGSTGFINGNNGDQVGISAGLDDILKNNGGPTDTMALLSGSTAINNGGASASSTDQRGAARVGVSDIGAFEFNGIPLGPVTVTTNAATNVGATSATLNATINPNGLPTSFQFTSDFASFAAQDAGSGTAGLPFSVNVTGLTPNTQYHFNVVAMSNGVTTQGVQQTFTTLPGTTLANISGRLPVGTGDNALFAGFIITGTQPKKVIIRGIGPSLAVAGKLADPILELHDGSGALLEMNDNWVESPNKQAIIDSTIPPSDPEESAIVRTVPPGNYTAIVRGAGNATGIGVVDLYDLDRSVDSKLANISNRGFVQTGDNVLFAGMIVLGQAPQKVIIRALGPSVPVPGAMADPTLELHDSNGALLEANDNWVDSPNKQAIIDSTIPPTNNLESAIVRTLTPANYTAIVRGVGGTTGIAVVEVCALQ